MKEAKMPGDRKGRCPYDDGEGRCPYGDRKGRCPCFLWDLHLLSCCYRHWFCLFVVVVTGNKKESLKQTGLK